MKIKNQEGVVFETVAGFILKIFEEDDQKDPGYEDQVIRIMKVVADESLPVIKKIYCLYYVPKSKTNIKIGEWDTKEEANQAKNRIYSALEHDSKLVNFCKDYK